MLLYQIRLNFANKNLECGSVLRYNGTANLQVKDTRLDWGYLCSNTRLPSLRLLVRKSVGGLFGLGSR